MKYQIEYSSIFSKDVSRLNKRGLDLSILKEAIEILEQEGEMPKGSNTHYLHSNFKGCLECHIQEDWLLIWKKDKHKISLVRTGTHNDLF